MKQYLKSIPTLPIIIVILLMIFFSMKTDSKVNNQSYKEQVSNTMITSNIEKDGSLTVVENRRFIVGKARNGIKFSISKAGNIKLSNLTIKDNTSNMRLTEVKNGELQNTPANNCFMLTSTKDYYIITVYKHMSNTQEDISLSYNLKNAVVKHKDGSSLQYRVVGNNFGLQQNNVSVIVSFPKKFLHQSIKVYSHSSDKGYINYYGFNSIIAKADKIKSGGSLEFKILFPNSMTSASKSDYTVTNEQLAEDEKSIMEQYKSPKDINTLDVSTKLEKITKYLFILSTILTLLYMVKKLSKYRNVSEKDRKRFIEAIGDSPVYDTDSNKQSIIKSINNTSYLAKLLRFNKKDVFLSGILDLVDNNVISIDDGLFSGDNTNIFSNIRVSPSPETKVPYSSECILRFIEGCNNDNADSELNVKGLDEIIKTYNKHIDIEMYNDKILTRQILNINISILPIIAVQSILLGILVFLLSVQVPMIHLLLFSIIEVICIILTIAVPKKVYSSLDNYVVLDSLNLDILRALQNRDSMYSKLYTILSKSI